MSDIQLWPARATERHVRETAEALRRAIAEHGVPNRFTAGELARHYGGPTPSQIGLVLTQRLDELCQAVGREVRREREGKHLPVFVAIGDPRP